jgi:putative peptide zinc metalloprotease protein
MQADSSTISADMLQQLMAQSRTSAPPKPTKVPVLREELRLISAANNADGSPAWMIQDPVNNKFYRIGWLDFELLLRWPMLDIASIIKDVYNETTLDAEEANVADLIGFLAQHKLLQSNNADAVNRLITEKNNQKQSAFAWLIHHYLFFRIPLVRPQVFLAKLLPYVRWIFSPITAFCVFAITLVGLFLVARQWETFSTTFIDQLTITGFLSYGVALLFSKCLHEFGHAITATRYGVRVAHMGVALLVMAPLPYTDTSESWKLSDNKQRLHIAAAGIITELALAGVATLAWSVADDGPLKSALFFLATTSWLLTLAVNASPFMRFDGYFITSDLLDFPNLHERAGAMAKTWLRRTVLGVQDAWPEDFSPKKRRLLIIFSSITWVYRMTVFLGIAWLVYYLFFKVLGILLFIVEIGWFVVLPIWRELSIWFKRRAEIKLNRIIIGLGLLGGLIALGLMPWQTTVKATGWLHATRQHQIFTPTAGKLAAMVDLGITQKVSVKQGQRIFTLTSPDIALNALKSLGMAQARAAELKGLSGMDDGESKRANLENQQAQFNAEVKLYKDELSRMDLTAPFTGTLQDADENLTLGTWVQPKQPMAVLIDPQSWAADVLVEETEISRIKVGDNAHIYLNNGSFTVLEGTVTAIDTAKVSNLPHPMLDAQYGGKIATLPGDKLIPTQGYYKVRVSFNAQPNLQKMTVANVKIETEAKAWLPTVFERVAALFVRESGF